VQGDINVYNIAELGVGLNQKACLCGRMLEDEGVLGVVHIGIGTNISLRGKIETKIHGDLLMDGVTLIVDKESVLEEGQLAFV
jgi:2,5-dihydroxypyridine 5,6-dioxygenase